MKKIQLAALVILVAWLSGCLNDNSIPEYENVEGVVLLNEEPVENAKIHVRHHYDPGGYIKNDLEKISLNFQLRSSGEYVGGLYRYGENDSFSTFFEGSLSAGTNEITISDSVLSNGIIGYDIRGNLGPVAAGLLIVNRPDSVLPSMVPLARTNSSGSFTLESFNLPFRQTFTRASGARLDVTDSLQIIVTDEEQILKIQRVKIEPEEPNFIEIILN